MNNLSAKQMMYACASLKGKDGEYLLHGVREKHVDCAALNRLTPEHGCDMLFKWRDGDCHGLGWTPTEDAWKWLTSLMDIGATLQLFKPLEYRALITVVPGDFTKPTAYATKPQLEDAFYAALLSALLPLAVNGDEVLVWVREHIP